MDRTGRIRHARIDRYLGTLHPLADPVLARMEEEALREGIPILDRMTARLLAILVRFGGARRVLEVGTAIGYSTLHMARALPRGGRIVSVDVSPEMHRRARANLREAGVAGRVRLVTGAALDVLPRLVRGARFDLVFLDAAKQEYRSYAELALPALRRGGLLAADNLLWGGRTAGRPPGGERGDSTRALRAFNAWLLRHPGLEAVLLPVGDGAGVAVRREGGSLRGPVGA